MSVRFVNGESKNERVKVLCQFQRNQTSQDLENNVLKRPLVIEFEKSSIKDKVVALHYESIKNSTVSAMFVHC